MKKKEEEEEGRSSSSSSSSSLGVRMEGEGQASSILDSTVGLGLQ